MARRHRHPRKHRALCGFIPFAQAGKVGEEMNAAELRVTGLRTEYQDNPLGIDVETPRFSWRICSNERAVTQSAYRLRVATDAEALAAERATVWDTGKVISNESIFQPYGGPALKSRQRYYWQVSV